MVKFGWIKGVLVRHFTTSSLTFALPLGPYEIPFTFTLILSDNILFLPNSIFYL